MTDTIDLLETIGSDASLRYASADELQGVLREADDELVAAVAAGGDSSALRISLGGSNRAPQAPQTQASGFGDDGEIARFW